MDLKHILIIDDHAFVCEGLKATLSEQYDNVSITTIENCDEAFPILSAETINLVILDLFMSGGSGGFSFISQLSESYPKLPLIVLSASENSTHIRKCLELGVKAFVTKSAPKGALFEAISKVMNGEQCIPKYLIESIPEVAKIVDEVGSGATREIISELITGRQMDILRCISRGYSNKHIARELDLSENTVKVHVSAMLRALGLRNRTQAGILGQKLGLLNS